MKVGDYVRTNKGFIGKAKVITQYNVNIEDKKIVQLKYITKTSPNIIDLIEVGDYVNGQKVNFIHKDIYEGEEWVADKGLEEDIKSIVTNKQFESMEYRIEE